jgi:hypothetical protein
MNCQRKKKMKIYRIARLSIITTFFITTFLLLAAFSPVRAQSMSQYAFTPSSGVFFGLNGATVQRPLNDDLDVGIYPLAPIGFNFKFNDVVYTTVSASTDGWMSFGRLAGNGNLENSLNSGLSRPFVAPLWDDLAVNRSNGSVSYITLGTAPNRQFRMQWINMQWKHSFTGSTGAISFQVILYETTNVVQFVYRPEIGALYCPNAENCSASIGLAATQSGSGNFLSLSNSGTNPTVSTTTETTTIGTKPAAGQTYTFTPVFAPDVTVTKTHSGNFTQGDTGKTYSITVANSGAAATSGLVSVSDALPNGLGAVDIGGAGWSCNFSNLTCTRTDALGAGNSYPPITLTVNVAANAPGSVTNFASVSGGGETNTGNNQAADPTTIGAAPRYAISGTIRYGTTNVGQPDSFVSGVNLNATGTASASAISDSFGIYQLSNLLGGNYTVTPSKTGEIRGINSLDATRIQQHLVGLTTLTPNQLIAADTDGNGTVNSLDATRIQQRAVGMQTPNIIGQWKFVLASRQYNPLGGNQTGQDYQAILVGEVSGNWATAASLAANFQSEEEKEFLPETDNQNQTAERFSDDLSGQLSKDTKQSINASANESTIELLAPVADIQVPLPTNAMASNGATVTIPITVSQISAASPIESFDFTVFYNAAVLQPALTVGSNAGTLSANCLVLPFSPVAGRVIVSGACAQAMTTGSGVIYNLTFNVIGATNQTSGLSFVNPVNNASAIQFNNGAPTIAATNGLFTVLAPTAASVSVSGRVLTGSGRGLMNATVTMTDTNGNKRTARTGAFGYFRFNEVEAGQTYIFNVSSKRYSLAPQVISVMEDVSELNFTAQN